MLVPASVPTSSYGSSLGGRHDNRQGVPSSSYGSSLGGKPSRPCLSVVRALLQMPRVVGTSARSPVSDVAYALGGQRVVKVSMFPRHSTKPQVFTRLCITRLTRPFETPSHVARCSRGIIVVGYEVEESASRRG